MEGCVIAVGGWTPRFINKIKKMLSYRRETALQGGYDFGQTWKTGTGRQYFTDNIGLSSTTVI